MTLKDIACAQRKLNEELEKVYKGFEMIKDKEWVTTKELKAAGLESYTRNCAWNNVETKIEIEDLYIPTPEYVCKDSTTAKILKEQGLIEDYYEEREGYSCYWFIKSPYHCTSHKDDKSCYQEKVRPRFWIKGKRKYYKVASII